MTVNMKSKVVLVCSLFAVGNVAADSARVIKPATAEVTVHPALVSVTPDVSLVRNQAAVTTANASVEAHAVAKASTVKAVSAPTFAQRVKAAVVKVKPSKNVAKVSTVAPETKARFDQEIYRIKKNKNRGDVQQAEANILSQAQLERMNAAENFAEAEAQFKAALSTDLLVAEQTGEVIFVPNPTLANESDKANALEVKANYEKTKAALEKAIAHEQDMQAQLELLAKRELEGKSSLNWKESLALLPARFTNYFWVEATGVQRLYRIAAAATAAALGYTAWAQYNAEVREDEEERFVA